MGAGASIEIERNIYLAKECGCIYRCTYSNGVATDDVGLMKCCYACLEDLRRCRFDFAKVDRLVKHTYGQDISHLKGWVSAEKAAEEARRMGIRSVEEFLYNTDILARYRGSNR